MRRIILRNPNSITVTPVDPATLDWNGFWRDYNGSPWLGSASVGDSAAHHLTEIANPPAIGSSLNGHTSADADGINDQLIVENGASASHYMTDSCFEGYFVFEADAATSAQIDASYNEVGILVDNSGSIGITFTDAGFGFFRNVPSIGWHSVHAPCSTGQVHVGTFRWDGANNKLAVGIDGPPNTSMFAQPLDISIAARSLFLLRNFSGAAYFNGKLYEAAISKIPKSDSDYTGIVTAVNQRYGLSLTQPSNFTNTPVTGGGAATHTYTGTLKTNSAAYAQRDGAHLHYNGSKYVLLGGWHSSAIWGEDQTTNEIWSSVDLVNWTLEKAHDHAPPTTGSSARWTPRHTFGSVQVGGYIYVVGSDQYVIGVPDVWRSPNGIDAWEQRTNLAPWRNRTGLCVGSLGGDIHAIGGTPIISSVFQTAQNSHYVSSDGGITWRQLPDPPFATSYCTRLVELDGLLFVMGGCAGSISNVDIPRIYQNFVWAFDGTKWHRQCASAPWSGRIWVDQIAYDGRIWVLPGRDTETTDTSDAWYSTDLGVTWTEVAAPWPPTHADGVCATSADGIVMATGFGVGQSVYTLKAN